MTRRSALGMVAVMALAARYGAALAFVARPMPQLQARVQLPQLRTRAVRLHARQPTEMRSRSQAGPRALPLMLTVDPVVVKASVRACSELLATCALGVVAAKKGVLDRTAVSSLSKVWSSVLCEEGRLAFPLLKTFCRLFSLVLLRRLSTTSFCRPC